MANWTGAARSNYFRVKDLEGLKRVLEPFDIKVSPKFKGDADEAPQTVCLLSESELGDWPSYCEDEEGNEIGFSWEDLVVPFLAEGEVLVIVEAGHEKMRYVTGWAHAYTWDGRMTSVSMNDIYAKAAQVFGLPIDRISEASY